MTRVEEIFEARGHAAIMAMHEMSFEITKETHLTRKGDCIIGVAATKGAADLSQEFKTLAENNSSTITVLLSAGGIQVKARGRGSSKLQFTHPTDLVARKSTYTCRRTLMICSDMAACDFPRRFVRLIRDPECTIKVRLIAEV
jgi:hypothetical protein